MSTKAKRLRSISQAMLLVFCYQLFFPTAALALTGGPSQPEFTGFKPVNATDMVNLFTGDFSYNLPLLEVPGPNGSYPINLAYNAGIGMEQEASWVGLGWDLNVGSVNRSLRGLPDDFNGDKVRKRFYRKSNWNVGFTVGPPGTEIFNMDATQAKLQAGIYYDSYKGAGFSVALDPSFTVFKILEGNLSLNFDSNTGMSFNPKLSLWSGNSDAKRRFSVGVGASFHSIQGFNDVGFVYNQSQSTALTKLTKSMGSWSPSSTEYSSSNGAFVSFAKGAYVPDVNARMRGINLGVAIKPGYAINGKVKETALGANFSDTWVSTRDQDRERSAYGYLYSHNRNPDDDLADFSRDLDHAVTKNSPYLAIPSFNYDTYMVSGQGVGSAFRASRSDIGILNDPNVESTNGGGNADLELGFGSDIKIGGDVNVAFGNSKSGTFDDDDDFRKHFDFHENLDYLDNLTDQQRPDEYQKYEAFYFKSAGDMVATESDNWAKFLGEKPIAFRMGMKSNGFKYSPKVSNYFKFEDEPYSFEAYRPPLGGYKEKRERRSKHMLIRTIDELGGNNAQTLAKNLVQAGQFPKDGESYLSKYDYPNDMGSHVGSIQTTTADGMIYNYEIPAYNTLQKDVVFAINQPIASNIVEQSRVKYLESKVDVDNDQGRDEFFTSTELPKYAHSHLLTSIFSSDYVDLTGDGPTDDDFGFWVKFNYTQHTAPGNEYEWRHPYEDANYAPGYLSDNEDDKASYTYGKKEIYYLNSVETKTHIAEFHLNATDRYDALGAKGEHGNGTAKTLKSLDKIVLYSKLDPQYQTGSPEPIKTVQFNYNYSLCSGALNSSSGGKLTLHQLHTTYGNSNKGSLNPYTFNYEASTTQKNPNYSLSRLDRWGNYKAFANSDAAYGNHINNPYVNQYADYNRDGIVDQTDEEQRSDHASSWSLRSIVLPSGGSINIDYESDDYAYVQDKRATDMMKITGIGGPTSTNIHDNDAKVYFEPHEGSAATSQSIAKYYDNLVGQDAYFKVYMELKKKPNSQLKASDYVMGYGKIKNAGFDQGSGKGWVVFENVIKFDGASNKVNPITKAGWQYLKLNRSDLFNQPSGTVIDPVGSVWKFLKSAMQLIVGYYNYCDINQYCRDLDISSTYESFIRLEDNDGIKYGGGHRVKRITVSDAWNSMTGEEDFSYGQEYEYRLANGESSGVAAYEPMTGGDENPLKTPIRYDSDELALDDEQFYLDAPIAEGFYPSPQVGYSRVVVKNIMRDEEKDQATGKHLNAGSGSAVKVNEFYTAKDFPVLVDHTRFSNDVTYKSFFGIPFIGMTRIDNRGFSQGYSVTMNDMHGKPKSMTTYKHGLDYNDPNEMYSFRQFYNYHTIGGENANSPGELVSTVPVLFGESIVEMADLGKTMDFFIDVRNNETYSESIGAQIDFLAKKVGTIYLPFPTAVPFQNYQERTFSSVVTNKVIFKSGILQSVNTYSDGVTTTVENHYYDSETGRAIVKKLDNEFEDNIYSMEIPAHWYHNFGGIYQNIGVNLEVSTSSNSGANEVVFNDVVDHRSYLIAGDRLKINGSVDYWVDEVSSGFVKIKDKNNSYFNPASGLAISVYESGYKNNLNASLGSVLSKKDPIKDRIMPAFTVFNSEAENYLINNPGASAPSTLTASATDCDDNIWNIEVSTNPIYASGYNCLGNPETGVLYAKATRTDATSTVKKTGFKIRILNKQYLDDNPITDVLLQFARSGDKLVITNLSQTKRYYALIDYCDDAEIKLGPGCLEGVINATAASVSEDTYQYNYEDLLDFNRTKITTYLDPNSVSVNPYFSGKKGNFRSDKTYVYKTSRTGNTGVASDISKDGELSDFMFYDHFNNEGIGSKWIAAEELTLYDPYGYSLESKDALGIHSAVMMGYGNSLVTAAATNSKYGYMAFESFEEHDAPTYDNVGIGHIELIPESGATMSIASEGHTGSQSLQFTGELSFTPSSVSALEFNPYSSYRLYAWIKGDGILKVNDNITISNSTVLSENIDGWNLHYISFKSPSPASDLKIIFEDNTPGDPSYIDDFRMQPFQSSMSCYVYDRHSFRLLATLDERNYAEIYIYDEENNLIKVNRETEQGIITVQESRSNLKR